MIDDSTPLPTQAPGDLEALADRQIARFADRVTDWDAFADARVEGYKRAQHRYIGAGGSGKFDDPGTIEPHGFTLSVMFVPAGQGNAAHTHEVEEVFFVLRGLLTVFFDDADGNRVSRVLQPWDAVSCPAGIIHGYQNNGVEPAWFQVMLGRARPELMGYVDPELLRNQAIHLTEPR